MALSTQPYKGARDFYPQEKRVQNYIFDTWRKVVKKFGYEEYDAPILEPIEIYASKTSEEIVNEQTYAFEDRGGRKVVIRPEMTPSVSRMVAAKRQELPYPLRLFSIPNLWRYERPQRGRLREHWQLNVDIFGESGIAAEHEMIAVADGIMKEFGASGDMYEVRINSRKALNQKIEQSGVRTSLKEVVRLIDAFEKLETDEFKNKLSEHVKDADSLYRHITEDDAGEELGGLIKLCEEAGIKVKYTPSLARGFDYYTDIVFEIFDKNPENNRSLFGGGRYDGLVGTFGVEPVPTVGFGMGDVGISNFLETHNLLPKLEPATDVAAILVGDVYASSQLVLSKLRDARLNVSVDATDRKLDKKIKSASKSGVQYALFIGEEELGKGQFSLKNLNSGEETQCSLNEVIDKLQ